MRRIVLRTILSAAVLAVPAVAAAAISLSPIMESWNHSTRQIDAMLSGRTPYNEAQLRHAIQRYVESSTRVARDMNGGSAEARDLAARFEAFASDSRDALATVAQPAAMSARFNRIVADCRSCHAIYNN
jgi:cytochrome c556